MCELQFLEYNIATLVYTDASQVRIVDKCNGMLLHNTGNTNLIVNGDILTPGQSKSIGGNLGEIFTGPLQVRFITPSPAPSPIDNEVTVTSKFYTRVVRPRFD